MSTFATVFVALLVAHQVADHWVQTDGQARLKGEPGWAGRLACAGHVLTYTVTAAVFLAVTVLVLDVDLHLGRAAIALTVSAVTHYISDRRTPLIRMAHAFGAGPMVDHCTVVRHPDAATAAQTGPGTGLYHLDQSWHYAWLWVAALICA